MSESADQDLAPLAVAIGNASRDPDLRFAAKHWGRVDDPVSVEELLRLARGAATVKPPPSAVYSSYSKSFKLGDWLEISGYHAQVVHIGGDGKVIHLAYYGKGKYHSVYTYSSSSPSDLAKHPRIEAPIK